MTQSVAVAGIGAVGVRARGDLRDGLLGSTALVAVMPGSVLRRRLQRLRSVSDPRTVSTIARGALFASTALVGMALALAVPAAAQQALSAPAGGGTITANDATNLQVNNNTGANGGYYVGNIEDENHQYHNRPITLNSVTINATATGTNSGADALYASSVFGNSNQVNLNGTNNIRTTVDGGAAIHEYVGANGGLGLSSSGSTLTGSYGILVQVPIGFYGIATNGYTATLVGAGTHVAGISVTANSDPYGGVDAHTGQFNISGFDTGITVTTSNGAPNGPGTGASTVNTSGGGTISANTTGIAVQGLNDAGATVTNGSAIVAPTGISATTNGGVISITTVAGGTINSTASGTGTGIAVTNSGGANPVTVTVGAAIGGTTQPTTGINVTGAGTAVDTIAANADVRGATTGISTGSAFGTTIGAGATVRGGTYGINAATGGSVVNNGTIGGYYSVYNNSNAAFSVNNTGTIAGDAYGVFSGTNSNLLTSSVTNSGTLSASSGSAIYLYNGGTVTNSAGTISGGSDASSGYAVLLNNGTIRVDNNATITGGGAGAIYAATFGTITLNLNAGSTTTGAVKAMYGPATESVGGTVNGAVILGMTGTTIYGSDNFTVLSTGILKGAAIAISTDRPLTLSNAGKIVGSTSGIVSSGTASITNTGTIGGGTLDGSNNFAAGGGGFAVEIAGGTVNNLGGTLQSGGAGVYQTNAAATLKLVNTGTIGGLTTAAAPHVTDPDDTVFAIGAATVFNSGTIATPLFYAVSLAKGGLVTNAAGGLISAGTQDSNRYGVHITGASGTVNNYGTIKSTSTDLNRGIQTDDNAATINLYAGSTTGSIVTGAGSDTLTLYNGTGTASTGVTYDSATNAVTAGITTGATKYTVQAAGTHAAAAFATGATVNLGGGTNTLTLRGTGDGTTANGAAGSLDVSTITNATHLVKSDAGTWTLTGNPGTNDFQDTGSGVGFVPAVSVSAGRLITGNPVGQLDGRTVDISSAATLELNVATLVYEDGATFTGAGVLQKTNTGNFASRSLVALAAGGLIDVQAGGFTASSDFQGRFTGNLGSLNVATAANFYTSEAAVVVDKLTGTGTVNTDISGSFTVGINNGSATFSGVIVNQNGTPGGTLTKTGTGAQALAGANTYTGATTISGGTLALASNTTTTGGVTTTTNGTIATSSGVEDDATFDISGLTNGGTTIKTLAGSGAVKLGANKLTINTASTIAASFSDGGIANGTGGQVELAGGGTYQFSGTNTYTGATTIDAGTTLQGTTVTLPGNSAIIDNGTLAFVQGGVGGTYAPGISGSGGVTVSGTGTGTLTFSGALTDTLGVLISDGSNVAITSTGSISASTGTTASAIYGNGANFTVSNAGTISAPGNQGAQYGSNGIYATNGVVVNNTGNIFGIPQGSTATYRSDGIITFGTGIVNNTGATYSGGTLTGNTAGGGVITGGWDGAYVTANGSVYNSGTIAGGTYQGVAIQGIGTLSNYAGGRIVGVSSGVEIDGVATVVNNGLIEAGTYNSSTGVVTVGTSGYGIYLTAGGSVTNGALANTTAQNTASQIVGGSQAATYSNAALMLTNYGAISSNGTGTVDAVTIQGTATVVNAGTITAATGGASGIAFVGTGSSIVNSGKITGGNNATYGYGLQAAGAAAGSITNQAGGTITASVGGIGRLSTGAVAIDNSGIVTGTGGTSYGVNITGGTGTIVNRSGGVIVGQTDGILSSVALNVSNAGTIGTGTVAATGTFTVGGSGFAVRLASGTVTNSGTLNSTGASVYQTSTTGTLNLVNTNIIGGAGQATNPDDTVVAVGTGIVLNSGMITTPNFYAVSLLKGGSVTNAAGGVISGGNAGARYGVNVAGASGTINNYGSITNTPGSGDASALGILTDNNAATINLFAGSTTGSISLQGGNDTVSLYTGTTNAAAIIQGYTDAVSGVAGSVVLQAAGTLQQAAFGAIALGSGTNTLNLMGNGTGTLAGSINLANVTGTTTTLNKIDAGTWTLGDTGTVKTTAGIVQINAGNGGTAGSGGVLQFNGTSGLTAAINVNGAKIQALTAGAFGGGTITTTDPTVEYSATGTYANAIVLGATSAGDPTRLEADAGLTATLSGTITSSGAGGSTLTAQPVVFDGGGTIVLTNTGNAWTGLTTISNGSTLSIAAAANVGTGGFAIGDATTVGTLTTTNAGAITLAGGVALGAGGASINVVNATGNTTLSGVVSGGPLTVNNAGTLTLSNTETYTGSTTITAGKLALTGTGSIASSSGVTDNGVFDISAHTGGTSIAGLSGTGGVTLGGNTLTLTNGGTYAGVASGMGGLTVTAGNEVLTGNNSYNGTTTISGGNLSLGNGGTTGSVAGPIALVSGVLTINRSNAVMLTGAISGGGSLVQAGAGTTTLSGANTYTGTTTVNAGTLAVSGGAAIADVSAVTVNTGGTFQLLSSETIGSLAGAGNVVLGANTLTTGGLNASPTFSGVASGTGGITKVGTGTLTLAGANTYTGATTVSAGTLALGATNAIGAGSAVAVASGATLTMATYNDTVASLALAGTLAGTGTLTAATYTLNGAVVNANLGAGTLNQASGTSTLNGTSAAATVNINGGTLATGSAERIADNAAVTIASGALLSLGGAETIGSLAGAGNVALGANTLTTGGLNASPTFSGVIAGAGGLTKVGTGTLTLSGVNSYTGATTINAGTLAVSGGMAIADASAVTIASAGTLQLNNSETIGSLAGAGNVTLGANTLTTGGLNASPTFSGVASGTGGITKVGTGTLTLSGANTFTGTLEIAGGTVAYGANNVLADTVTVLVDAGATFNLNGYSDTIGTLNLYGTLSNGGLLTATTYNAYAGSTIGQAISSGTLNVYGNTSLTAATAANPVNINSGTLTTASAELLSDTGAINIASGGTLALGGNETIGSLSDLAFNGTTNGGTVKLGANTLIVGGANTSTGFSGTITDNGAGTGSLTKTGTGTLILSGANSYNGTTTISGGTLQGTTTSIVGSTIVDNATLAYNQSASGTVSQGITGSGIVTVAGLPAGSALTFTGTNSQTGGFAVTDASTVAFTGTNGGAPTEVALQGAGTLVNTGMLTGTTTGIAATAASGTATILNASTGTIVGASYGVQSSGAGTLALTNYGTITGPVSALSTGANVLSLRAGSTTGAVTTGSGDDTLVLYTGFVAANPVVDATTGLTLRAAGTYAAASFGAIDLGAGANVLNLRGMGDGAANGAASSIDLSTVANAGTITKQDAGTWTLTGAVADAVTSAATINAGIGGTPGSGGLLVFAGSGLTGTINVNGATIRATAAGAFGTGTINAIDPTIQYAATGTYANPIVLQSTNPTSDPTTLQTFGTGITATLSGTITQANAPQPLVFSSINTNGSQGTGTFVLTNAGNAWTGVTTVSAGTTLRGTTATLSGASFTDNGVLNFNQAAAGTSARAISGTGTVLIDGGGPVTLTGAITAAGGVQIGANTTATLSNVSGNGNTTVFLSGNNAVLNVAQGGTITATNGGAVFGTAQNGTVNNAGTVTSTGNFSAIFFNPNLGTAAVTNTGTVNAFGSAIYAGAGTALSVTNSGTLTSTNRPAILANTATITNTASGVMTGFFGVYTNGAMTLANAGQITAAGAGGNAVTAGGGSIVNTGTLTATTSGGWGVLLTAAGSADNQGTINADSGMVAAVSGVTFSNEGTINAAVNGVWGLGSPVTLTNNGTINAGTTGVLAEAAGSSITNSGTIAGSASGAIGVAMAGGTLTNQSGGVISAGQTNGAYGTAIQLTGANNVLALQAGSTVNGLIDASATTDGSNGYTFSGNLNGGFTGGSGNDTVTLVTPVTVTGTLDGGAGTDTLVLDGTGAGTLGSAQVVNFENGVKQGSGTWTLTGTTAASPTSFAINAGTLAVAGGNALADNGAVTIASGATLQLNNSETIGSLAGAGNVTLGANTLTTGGLNASPTFSGVASGTGGLTKIGTGTLTLAGVNTYTGATTVSAGTLAVSGGNAIADTSAVTIAAAGTLQLNASETIGSLSGAGNVALGANTLTTGGLNASPTFSGVIAGGGGLTKVGTGTLTLSGVNTYTGATTINAGTLAVSGGMAIADASAVAIASGATLQLNNSETIGSLAGAGNVTLGANTLTTGGLNASPTFSGVASGTGGLTKIGTGTLTLAGANTYTGATTVSAGTLALGATNAIGAGSAVTVASGATLNLATYNDTVASLALNGTLAGTGTLTAATYTLNGAVVNANLGAGTLNQAGGTSVLNGTAGAATVNVNGGTLSLGANDRLADNAALTVASGATLNMGAFTDTVGTAALNGTLAGTGTLTAATYTLNGAVVNANLGAGTLNQAGGTSVLNGTAGAATVNVNGGTLSLGANDRLADNATVLIATGAALNMATFTDTVGLAQIAGMLNGTGTLTAAEYDLSGATVNANLGTGNLFQQTGTSTLNGTSNAANVMITGGTLVLGASNRLADTAAVGVATGATLNIGANTDTVGTLALNGTLAGTGTLTATTYTLNNAAVNANLGTGTLVQASGTSVLSGTAATNMVAVMAGTLRLGASDRIADAATVGVASGATFDLAGYNETVGTLAGSGTLSLGAGTLTAGGTNADYAFGGNVTGTGDLTKVGTGTFSLIGNEAMTGRLNVNAGTLMLAGTTAGSVRVQGGTLTGASTIAGNLLLSSGTLSPGIQAQPVAAIQAGSLTVTGGTTVFDFGGMASGFTADLLKVTGAATLTGGTVTTRGLDPSASYKMEQVYTVVQAGTLTGTYASGSTFTQVSNNADLYYRLRYDLLANGVVLEVRKPVDFTTTLGTGASGNQLAVARALNGGVLTGSDAFVTALNAISQLSPDQRRSTLDNLGGESIADISTSVALVGNRFNELLRHRLAVGGAGNSADPSLIAGIAGGKRGLDQVRASGQVGAEGSSFADGSANNHAGAWVQTFGGAGKLDGLAGTASIRDQSYGVAAGIDVKVAGLSVGGAFAASALDTRVAGRSATNTGTLYQGGGYVAYDNGTAYASAVGSYFSGDVTSSRQVYIGAAFQGTAIGTPKVTGYTAGGAAGYRVAVGGGVRFTPQVSFQATHVDRAAFTETGAGVLSLSAGKDVRTLYTATAEGRLSYLGAAPGGIIEPYVGAGAAFAFGDLNTVSANQFTGAPTGTGAFSITGARLSPTTALINGGIEAHPNDRVTLGMGVETRLSNRQRDGRVELHVRLGF